MGNHGVTRTEPMRGSDQLVTAADDTHPNAGCIILIREIA